MNKKTIVVVVLSVILFLSVSSVLVINGFPDLTYDWTVESKSILKQYIKLLGFISVMGLVYTLVEGFKKAKPEDQDAENEVIQ
ncbi:hypothetical protein GQR60_10415 [Labilibaculum sp. A4]|uniref:Uncharacterized protein n=1 Tax=Labilibaculum manganireducens TaxID=1940525 RepID=A0A2N3IGH5_9BACT|nr:MULTISPECIES: hypothetical protein [Labilibaculum]MDQ1772665.1 hypothetical protein [Labilibaculum euxinus]MWN76757.1 hypothetical protein [Labilibaculum euxinus]PKQ69419.1 hypothetical protein BZG01_00350 [Labilibaculum manganireducens]